MGLLRRNVGQHCPKPIILFEASSRSLEFDARSWRCAVNPMVRAVAVGLAVDGDKRAAHGVVPNSASSQGASDAASINALPAGVQQYPLPAISPSSVQRPLLYSARPLRDSARTVRRTSLGSSS